MCQHVNYQTPFFLPWSKGPYITSSWSKGLCIMLTYIYTPLLTGMQLDTYVMTCMCVLSNAFCVALSKNCLYILHVINLCFLCQSSHTLVIILVVSNIIVIILWHTWLYSAIVYTGIMERLFCTPEQMSLSHQPSVSVSTYSYPTW